MAQVWKVLQGDAKRNTTVPSLAVAEFSVAVMKRNNHLASYGFGSVSLRPSVNITGPYKDGKAAIDDGEGLSGSTPAVVTTSWAKRGTKAYQAEKKSGAPPSTKISAGNLIDGHPSIASKSHGPLAPKYRPTKGELTAEQAALRSNHRRTESNGPPSKVTYQHTK